MKRFAAGIFFTAFAFAVPASPRVVSLSPAVTEAVCRLDAGDCLVGRSDVCDTPDFVRDLPVAGRFGIPDPEKILLLHADVVITNDLVNPAAAKTLARRGVKVLVFPGRGGDDYRKMISSRGETLDRRDAAERETRRIADALRAWENLPRRDLRALMIVWENPPVVAGEESFCNELLRLSGVRTLDFGGKSGYFTPDAEFLLRADPDVVLTFHGAPALAAHPVLKRLRAVREGKIVELADEGIFQRPGPRWTEAVEILRERWSAL
ncbi:MAG: helical backbone metal receptor [Victivallaceae bacterium]|nr:helical backbone metal receptor [Victivallaceae bacterium]